MTTKSKTISIIAIIAISAILMTTVIISQDAFAKCKKYRGHGSSSSSSNSQSQAIAQANVCGNGNLATNIDCQNLASQIQGNGNAVNVIGLH
ncbi:MAG: hypothetical protein WBP64_11530 [Nitrososphaeraceae archaeon]